MLGAHEEFWRGSFGDAYVERNRDSRFVAANVALFTRILQRTGPLESVLELGCNVGLNLRALSTLQPQARLTGVEINASAAAEARAWGGATIVEGSFLQPQDFGQHTLTFTKGVLIHIDPEQLTKAYDTLVRSSSRYVLVAEYYSPSPVMVPYRGESERLYKRDFAGELLDRHPHLSLVDYGFCWRRDPTFPMDDLTWFLLEQRS
ncbi:MAG: pseudaminic acid biosynthesis-associated methylase [Gemmatimonadaceae bacterium]|nr:pseudaminic acid biosynthesis-associated methylase [Gemmatimonadaceae bacterium]